MGDKAQRKKRHRPRGKPKMPERKPDIIGKKPPPKPKVEKAEFKEFSLEELPRGIQLNRRNRGKTRVLYLPLNARLGTQKATELAFIRAGFDLCVVDYLHTSHPNQSLVRLVELFDPDWLHMQLQFTDVIKPETLKKIREISPDLVITNWTGDVRAEAKQEFVEISQYTTKSYISSVGQLDLYREAGCENVEYWQIGVDALKFRPLRDNAKKKVQKKYKHDVVFCANINPIFPGAQLRGQVAEALSKKFLSRFKVYGTRAWKNYAVNYAGNVEHQRQNLVYNASKIVISINNFNDIYKYFSGRQLIAMATGSLVLSSYVPGLEEYFINKKHLVWFHTVEECVELAKYYIKHPKEAEEIGRQARKIILEEHTFDKRIEELAKRLGFK
jgi:glycosyltransferase involved in cell wall biosynthesis